MNLPRARGRDPRIILFATGTVLVAIFALGLLLRGEESPRFAIISPIAYFVAAFADIATMLVLFQTWQTGSSRRSTLLLAFAYGASGSFLFLALLTLTVLPNAPPAIPAPRQFGPSMFVLWHLSVAAGAFVYAGMRRFHDATEPTRRFRRIAGITTCAIVIVTSTASFVFAPHFPALMVHAGSALGLLTTGIGPVLVVLLATAAVVIFRVANPGPIDRALAFALTTLTLELGGFIVGGKLYDSNYYAGRFLVLISAMFVLVTAVRMLIQARSRLSVVEWTLQQVEDESAKRAARIRALWQIAAPAASSVEERFQTILDLATATLRPGRSILGVLSHLDGNGVVVDATSAATPNGEPHPIAQLVYPGATLELNGSLHRVLLDEGRTRAWNDIGIDDGDRARAADLNCRSFIGAQVTIERQTYFIVFLSPEPMIDDPFTQEDFAYVDVIASFFSATFTQQQQYARIQFQIEHDALTGLANRVHFRKALRDEIRRGRPFAMAFVDLDGFRHVNEREGHQIADEVLVEVATGLVNVARQNVVARTSADEFGILLRDETTSRSLTMGLQRYTNLFLAPFHTGDRAGTKMMQIGASIGAARFPADGSTAEELMLLADCALSIAKTRGGSTTMVFDNEMRAMLEQSNMRVIELSNAIAAEQLVLVYQPTFDVVTRKITGAEALVRWDHPERGRISPSEFIPFAERNGLIGAISRWVFHRVIRDLKACDHLPPGVRVYFNLAAQMLDDIPFITEMNASLHANPSLIPHLGVEVTESAAMQNVERSMSTIDLFRRWGMFVAIDDFGTGYSSLSYLKKLSVDVIKIDRSFIENLTIDERDGQITDMLLRITDQFGFVTLAEGIETEAQANWLLEHGCRLGQGYLVAKPDTFDELLRRLGVRQHAA